MKTTPKTRPGVTLIETLCAMVLITVLIGVLAMIMRESLEAERIQAVGYDRLQLSKAFADQFRADVARADKAPVQWNEFVAGGATLILQMKNDEHVVYDWKENVLKRLVFQGEEVAEKIFPIPPNMPVEFARTAPDARILRVRLSALHLGKAAPGRSLEFAAALGGDWR